MLIIINESGGIGKAAPWTEIKAEWNTMEIKCYCGLYASEGLEQKKNRVLRGLMEEKLQMPVYIITLSAGEQNHLEFFSSLLLRQHIYSREKLFIVGLAASKDGAAELVAVIAQEVLDHTGGTDIRSYIQRRQSAFEAAVL